MFLFFFPLFSTSSNLEKELDSGQKAEIFFCLEPYLQIVLIRDKVYSFLRTPIRSKTIYKD